MLSGALPEGCATQLVNPLNAFSLGCGHADPHGGTGRLPRTGPGGGFLLLPQRVYLLLRAIRGVVMRTPNTIDPAG